jgi:hypothetical protein
MLLVLHYVLLAWHLSVIAAELLVSVATQDIASLRGSEGAAREPPVRKSAVPSRRKILRRYAVLGSTQEVSMQSVAYGGWPNCVRLSNAQVELIATTDVGPRIIRFGFIGGENELVEFAGDMGQTGGDTWRPFGGHRLWHAPEIMPRTYAPDNTPIHAEQRADGALILTQPTEPSTGIAKQIEIRLDPQQARAQIIHRLTNHGPWPIELAPWAVTIMAPSGVAILPLPPFKAHGESFLPATQLVLWSYTNLADPRIQCGERYLLLHQDSQRPMPQKIGLAAPNGWIGYARAGRLFIKRVAYQAGALYPDNGSSIESFTNAEMLEIETLGPLTTLHPGETTTHTEDWELHDGVAQPTDPTSIQGLPV